MAQFHSTVAHNMSLSLLLRRSLAESNVHGLAYLVGGLQTRAERVAWLLCVAASAGLAVLLCHDQWSRFDQRPIVLSVETDYLNWRLRRPVVTLCYSSFNETTAAQLIRRYMWKVLAAIGNATTIRPIEV